MEIIKKRLLQKLTTGLTATSEGTFINIIPDLSATYSMKININNDSKDIGFFDVSDTVIPPTTTTTTFAP